MGGNKINKIVLKYFENKFLLKKKRLQRFWRGEIQPFYSTTAKKCCETIEVDKQ